MATDDIISTNFVIYNNIRYIMDCITEAISTDPCRCWLDRWKATLIGLASSWSVCPCR